MTDIMEKADYRRRMPAIGMRFTVSEKDSGFLLKDAVAEVVSVNLEHLYYIVQYVGSGLRECFSLARGTNYDNYLGRKHERTNNDG